MSSQLIVVTDMQRFKLYTTKKDPMGRESVELLQSLDSVDAHERISDKVSDQQGNFQGVGASGSGENHNLVLEEERRRIKEIASLITDALKTHSHDTWSLAAPKAINNHIVELLDASLTQTMSLNLHSDLTKTPDDELLGHFTK